MVLSISQRDNIKPLSSQDFIFAPHYSNVNTSIIAFHQSNSLPPPPVAVVTGASRGIGRAIALRLAQDGFNIHITATNSERLKDVKRSIEDLGKKCSIYVGDVSKEEVVKALIESAVDELGSVDVMVANAGICGLASITDMPVDDMDRHYEVNTRGTFLSYKYAAQQMIKQGRGGRIIGASSIAGKQGHPYLSGYVASKFAIRGLTQSAATEFGKYGITVNAYAPGAVETDMTKTLRDITGDQTPDYAANPSGFITGQSISINGGFFFD
ncbi:hypothetical protein BDQ17DRAFT_1545961 [Cyathus striatus]|nr:hypothetical protein BDQ17DRAFT_1545961 [Cyathus striatus]